MCLPRREKNIGRGQGGFDDQLATRCRQALNIDLDSQTPVGGIFQELIYLIDIKHMEEKHFLLEIRTQYIYYKQKEFETPMEHLPTDCQKSNGNRILRQE